MQKFLAFTAHGQNLNHYNSSMMPATNHRGFRVSNRNTLRANLGRRTMFSFFEIALYGERQE